MVSYALGLDFGSDSVRALLVDTQSGQEVATHVVYYPRWAKGLYCEPARDQFRQHPLDYIESTEQVLAALWQKAPAGAGQQVIGLSFDTTGSTPVAVDKDGVALALKPEFAENPNAMFVLWKDHTAVKEAAEFTDAANKAQENYLKFEGGIYSSEWYWSKALHVMRSDASVAEEVYMWVEHCDWLPALLTGKSHPEQLPMGRCAAGHKMMWHESWGGFPPNEFFKAVDPILDGLVERLPKDTYASDNAVGELTPDWADKLGLPVGIPVGFGAFDCHMGAVAANVKPGVLTKIMGTSTCDITVGTYQDVGDNCIPGICGQVDGSVVPGMIGLEAGQSAFGDLYAWFRKLVNGPAKQLIAQAPYIDEATKQKLAEDIDEQTLIVLSEEAIKFAPGQVGITAVDWVNGRRTPDADQTVAGAITGLKMGSGAAETFRGLVEATAFGARAIIERFREHNIAVDSVVAIGGISKKSDLVMQICADVWKCPIDVLESDQSCALGAAIFAAKIGGAYPDVASAQEVMASKVCKTYQPNSENSAIYDQLYQDYLALGAFVNGSK
ncbi:ribulokinase [Saccharobesus litoralis]|uniref:Ribulokinase n=1 Tax=Saccharobesus litoralis TaxID=2172099 RepID=A0A2S0VQC5_9ALTE|nr:ribulokinase [Saccharobesus litoralis]AWB66290.1 ribulokinase [Saccharobesus litoralis]